MYASLKPKSLVQCLEPSSINALMNEKMNDQLIHSSDCFLSGAAI